MTSAGVNSSKCYVRGKFVKCYAGFEEVCRESDTPDWHPILALEENLSDKQYLW